MFNNFKITSSFSNDAPYVNAYVKGFKVTFRAFNKITLEQAPEKYLTKDSLNSHENLKGKLFKLSRDPLAFFECFHDSTIELNPISWQPYKEIYLLATTRPSANQVCFVDKHADTYISKMGHNTWHKRNRLTGAFALVRWLVLPGTDLETAPHLILEDLNLITNLSVDKSFKSSKENDKVIINSWRDYHLPMISIDGPDTIKANSTETFNISVTHHEGEPCLDSHTYYVDCIQGYAPNKEVNVVDGKGSLKVMALGLEPGDKLRFKINDRTWTGKAEKILDVV
jgi:hypothetical protein